jgi:hypothetical protein
MLISSRLLLNWSLITYLCMYVCMYVCRDVSREDDSIIHFKYQSYIEIAQLHLSCICMYAYNVCNVDGSKYKKGPTVEDLGMQKYLCRWLLYLLVDRRQWPKFGICALLPLHVVPIRLANNNRAQAGTRVHMIYHILTRLHSLSGPWQIL